MINILIINTVGLNYEGITSVIYNYISNMNRDGFFIDFLCQEDVKKELAKKFSEIGNLVYTVERKKDAKQYIKNLNSVLKDKHYDVVHIHGNSGTMAIETILCKKNKVKKILVHCHNTTCDHPVVNEVLKGPMMWFSDELLACSVDAGHWLYGKKKYCVLNNAIDLEKYRYSPQIRQSIRDEYGISNEFIIGHSGHFSKQKNHEFLIDVFHEYYKMNQNTRLMLLSDGPDFENIREKVRRLSLLDNVIFVGRRADAWKYYNAFDLFILPSLWEGLPVVMQEAQANGLPVLASVVITKDEACTPFV